MIAATLADTARRLAAASDTPRLDAELLMAHALGVTREALLLGDRAGNVPASFAAFVARRLAHEPIAYIVGTRAFWSIELAVGPGVLVPRADSETLIEAAIAHFRGRAAPAHILDLGTGSGALLLAALAEWPGATGTGVDASDVAVAMARRNATLLGMAARAEIVLGGWATGTGRFDLILCNPPYVRDDADLPPDVARYEPAQALFGGADGLGCYRAIAPTIAARLAADGVAAIEIGCEQGGSAAALFRAQGLAVAVRQDLTGRDRCLVATGRLSRRTELYG